jgi:Ni/Co efflux regulator RcnB
MKRVIAMLAAAALLGGPLAMGGTALAKDHDGGDERHGQRDGGEGRGRQEAPQGGPRGGEERGGEQRGGEQRGGGRREYGGPQGDPRGYAPPQAYGPRYAPQYGPQYAPQVSSRARRGGYLAPDAGGSVPDYGRYRLRQPPRGYTWVRTANGYAMVRMETGQVFDVVPF